MDLFNRTITSLQEQSGLHEIERPKLCKERVNTLLRKIARGLRDKMDKLFLKILREDLQNPRRQTGKRMIFENNFFELMELFSLVNRVL